MKTVEDGIYNCAVYYCNNKAKHAQRTTKGTVLLCDDCFGIAWSMSPLGIKRLKEGEGE